MVINKPVPFNFLHGNMVQVNPLDGEAYPFPCQGRWDYVEAVTPVVAGTTTLVNFTGGAQHGGGSCQFAITYDWPPPIDKRRWKTIYTIIGGCPVSSNSGNLPSLGQQPQYAGREDADHCGNDGGDFCIRQFDVPIPKNLRNGNATFAWTWFNNMGNREMYMNCAPISISGGTDNEAYFEKLPSLFVANIPGECSMRHEMGVFNIPNPGVYGRHQLVYFRFGHFSTDHSRYASHSFSYQTVYPWFTRRIFFIFLAS
ncbi:hypothetical protein VTK73DRAFT_8020 [Phialemonium thermophilum]|uniref:Uncharacterized protein n=1 Tax=Phialemonium thermophilum TaxID=223376 RepID=A0ABR3XQ83_9PEZI